MKITLVYIYPESGANGHFLEAFRFLNTYHQFPPGTEHDTLVICNGGICDAEATVLFGTLPGCRFFSHDDSGWDIGGYIAAARTLDSDMMFCCGGHTYFRRAGWLKRMQEAWAKNGPGLYGTLASYEIRPHFCTTGIACFPELLRRYPRTVVSKQDRYEFEHGPNSLVNLAVHEKLPVRLVTWDGDWPMKQWRQPPNIYARGDQSNCLCYFRVSDSYEEDTAFEQARRRRIADNLTVPWPQ